MLLSQRAREAITELNIDARSNQMRACIAWLDAQEVNTQSKVTPIHTITEGIRVWSGYLNITDELVETAAKHLGIEVDTLSGKCIIKKRLILPDIRRLKEVGIYDVPKTATVTRRYVSRFENMESLMNYVDWVDFLVQDEVDELKAGKEKALRRWVKNLPPRKKGTPKIVNSSATPRSIVSFAVTPEKVFALDNTGVLWARYFSALSCDGWVMLPSLPQNVKEFVAYGDSWLESELQRMVGKTKEDYIKNNLYGTDHFIVDNNLEF